MYNISSRLSNAYLNLSLLVQFSLVPEASYTFREPSVFLSPLCRREKLIRPQDSAECFAVINLISSDPFIPKEIEPKKKTIILGGAGSKKKMRI